MMFRVVITASLLSLAPWLLAAEESTTAASAAGFSEQILDVSETVTLAGKVDVSALAAEYPQGLLLIDLRTTAEEGVAAEQQQAEAEGIRYENVPVAGASIDPLQLQTLRQLLSTRGSDEHVVIHCASGNRAGMMWGALQIDSGADATMVLESLLPIVTKAPAQTALLEYPGTNGS